jgi:eukaryotic-like serine/threonine-protein kinase
MTPGPQPAGDRSILANRYELKSVIGRGSFGEVYDASDVLSGARVVVKLFTATDERAREAFEAESRAASRLNHPNVVKLLEWGDHEGQNYLVWEYVAGESLATILKQGALPLPSVVQLGMAIAGALERAHAVAILHRDVKPTNVLIPGWPDTPRFENAKLLDFGVAGDIGHDDGKTRVGMIYGTPLYMSPEQVRGEAQSAATDVYGLGLLLYEAVTGSRLWRGRDAVELIRDILSGAVEERLDGVPPKLRPLILACVARDVKARPSMAQVGATLREMGGAVPEVPVSAVAAPAPKLAVPGAPVAQKPGRPTFAILVGLALLLAVAAASVAVFWTGMRAGLLVAGGLVLVVAGVSAGYLVRVWLGDAKAKLGDDAFAIATGAKERLDVTQTIAVQLNELVTNLRALDQRILAGTVALMLNEYQQASEAKDRQAALMNVVALSEKLTLSLSPWYVRYKDVIASAVAVAGAVSGLLTAYNGIYGGHK